MLGWCEATGNRKSNDGTMSWFKGEVTYGYWSFERKAIVRPLDAGGFPETGDVGRAGRVIAGAPRLPRIGFDGDVEALVRHAGERRQPVVVAGRNFGCGSSREHAPIALGSANCKVVVAESFARIFFRNCVATGELYPCECVDRLCEVLKTGDVVTVDLDSATVKVEATGKVYSLKPLGDVRAVVDAGGLFNYARQNGMIPART